MMWGLEVAPSRNVTATRKMIATLARAKDEMVRRSRPGHNLFIILEIVEYGVGFAP
jgi:hypothetical protein